MEPKFELDTHLTVSCVVAAALAYSLVTVSIAIDSHHPSIDPVCIVWVERTPGRVRQEKISG